MYLPRVTVFKTMRLPCRSISLIILALGLWLPATGYPQVICPRQQLKRWTQQHGNIIFELDSETSSVCQEIRVRRCRSGTCISRITHGAIGIYRTLSSSNLAVTCSTSSDATLRVSGPNFYVLRSGIWLLSGSVAGYQEYRINLITTERVSLLARFPIPFEGNLLWFSSFQACSRHR